MGYTKKRKELESKIEVKEYLQKESQKISKNSINNTVLEDIEIKGDQDNGETEEVEELEGENQDNEETEEVEELEGENQDNEETEEAEELEGENQDNGETEEAEELEGENEDKSSEGLKGIIPESENIQGMGK